MTVLPPTLRLLSYNIQAGLGMDAWSHYVTRSWRHVVPDWRSAQRLDRIARVLAEFDVVALQEVDGGSLRSSYINQLAYFADVGGFPFWHQQLNRDLGHLGQYSNGVLSRLVPWHVENHALPGLRGRGAIVARFGGPDQCLTVVCVHLALSERTRFRQLHFLRELLSHERHVVLMGDLNCEAEQLVDTPLRDAPWIHLTRAHSTYPSWRPRRKLDHVLISPDLQVESLKVLPVRHSDHLPVAIEIRLPGGLTSHAVTPPRGTYT